MTSTASKSVPDVADPEPQRLQILRALEGRVGPFDGVNVPQSRLQRQ